MNTIGFISAFTSPFMLWKVIKSESMTTRTKAWNMIVILAIIIVAVVLFTVRMVGWQYYG